MAEQVAQVPRNRGGTLVCETAAVAAFDTASAPAVISLESPELVPLVNRRSQSRTLLRVGPDLQRAHRACPGDLPGAEAPGGRPARAAGRGRVGIRPRAVTA